MGYASLDRTWKNGDIVEMEFPFDVRKVAAHPKVREDRGRMAVERGPIVYCAEGPIARTDARSVCCGTLGGAETLDTTQDFSAEAILLHGTARDISRPLSEPKPVKLIPYHLWANRGAAEMSVWLATAEYSPGDTGPAGGLIFYVNPNSATDGWRYLEAAPFDQSAGAPWGCFRTVIPGARGTGSAQAGRIRSISWPRARRRGSAAALCANFK